LAQKIIHRDQFVAQAVIPPWKMRTRRDHHMRSPRHQPNKRVRESRISSVFLRCTSYAVPLYVRAKIFPARICAGHAIATCAQGARGSYTQY
jgi:hypothetical protein